MIQNSQNILKKILLDFNQGNKQKSLLNMEEYVKHNPEHMQAKLNLAYMYVNLNLIDKAINEYKFILQKKENVQAMFSLAICFASINNFDDSKKILKKIILKDKNNFHAYRALADIYFKLKDFEKSFAILNKAIKLVPNDPILLNLFGMVEMKKGNYSVSENFFLKSIKLKTDYFNALNNLAALYQKIGKTENSLKIFKSLLSKYPNDQNLLNNVANTLIDLNKNNVAIKFLQKAIKINPLQTHFFSNLGRALFFNGNYVNAKKYLKKSLELNTKNYEAQLLLFYLLIIKKDLKNAWSLFDARLHVKNYFLPYNLGNQKKIDDSRILVLREAGLGDEILYSSMYLSLINHNNNVVIECDKRLKNIFKRSFNYDNFFSNSKIIRSKSNLSKFDFSIYAGSLSKNFRNNLSDFNYKNYLKPDFKLVEYYNKKLNKINQLPKIGISWISARADIGKDKSIELEELLPVLSKKNISFVNLQYGDFKRKIKDFNKKNNLNIIDIPKLDKFNDIEGLLALISSLNLVITVSNTTAHIAGSLGKKTFLLAPTNRAQLFYWMLFKKSTPWYPSIQIFKKKNNWKSALKEIQMNLNKIIK